MEIKAYFDYDVSDVAEYIDKEIKEFPSRSKEQNAWNAVQKYLDSFNNETMQFWLEDEQMNEIYEDGLQEYNSEHEVFEY